LPVSDCMTYFFCEVGHFLQRGCPTACGTCTGEGVEVKKGNGSLARYIGHLTEEPAFNTWMIPFVFLDYGSLIFWLPDAQWKSRTKELLDLVGKTLRGCLYKDIIATTKSTGTSTPRRLFISPSRKVGWLRPASVARLFPASMRLLAMSFHEPIFQRCFPALNAGLCCGVVAEYE
jgi:hypothetical protein